MIVSIPSATYYKSMKISPIGDADLRIKFSKFYWNLLELVGFF